MAKETYQESLYPSFGQNFTIQKTFYEDKSDHQHVVLFENETFGKVLAIDGVIQTTTKDEFIYHEMLTHVPILAHGGATRVLIIGGGDGGMLREVLRHTSVTCATMVEIDPVVIDFAKKYLPEIHQNAFDDPRADLHIMDGFAFVRDTKEKWDVIIVDSTDPEGPGEILFSEDFYRHCYNALNKGGIIVTQNGVPFLQGYSLKNSHTRLSNVFKNTSFYHATIPTYYGGPMAFGFASDEAHHAHSLEEIKKRYSTASIKCRYYTPEVHVASFALPGYMNDILTSS